jgi:hypothetical protein
MIEKDARAVAEAIDAFAEARRQIGETFGTSTAAEVVTAVLRGGKARNGRCRDGSEYLVHGTGYSVVLPGGAQAHIDAHGDRSDRFTAWDIRMYLDDLIDGDVPLDAVAEVCASYVRSGVLRRVDEVTFEFPVASRHPHAATATP